MVDVFEEMKILNRIADILEEHFKDLPLNHGIEISYYPNNQYNHMTFMADRCIILGEEDTAIEYTITDW